MTVKASVTATIPTDAKALATVYEDTNADGTADNTETLVLKDGTNDYQSPSLVGDSTYDYWIEFDLVTEDTSVTPTIDAVTIDPNATLGPSEITATTTLNGQVATATIYEDTTDDGTANNQITTALPNGTNTFNAFNLSGDTASTYWTEVDLYTFDTAQTPNVDSISLKLSDSKADTGSITTSNSSSISSAEVGTLTTISSFVSSTASPLSALEQGILQDPAGVSSSTATSQTTNEETISIGGGVSTLALGSILQTDTSTKASENPVVSGDVITVNSTSLPSQETGILSVDTQITDSNGLLIQSQDTTFASPVSSLTASTSTLLDSAETTFAFPNSSISPSFASIIQSNEQSILVATTIVTAQAGTVLTSPELTISYGNPVVTPSTGDPTQPDEETIANAEAFIVNSTASLLVTNEDVLQAISGTVTLNSTGVQGAVIYVIDTQNDSVVATETTDANGNYSVVIDAEPLYHVTVQYDDGNDKYNALSKPYIE